VVYPKYILSREVDYVDMRALGFAGRAPLGASELYREESCSPAVCDAYLFTSFAIFGHFPVYPDG